MNEKRMGFGVYMKRYFKQDESGWSVTGIYLDNLVDEIESGRLDSGKITEVVMSTEPDNRNPTAEDISRLDKIENRLKELESLKSDLNQCQILNDYHGMAATARKHIHLINRIDKIDGGDCDCPWCRLVREGMPSDAEVEDKQ